MDAPASAAPPRVKIMGILNVTPDSFSDGGRFFDPPAAIDHGLRMIADGASIIDIGAESTRPGSLGVDAKEQLARILPIQTALHAKADPVISIDTRSAKVAEACLNEGADIINDVSALRHDPAMSPLIAKWSCGMILTHMLGTPENMQVNPKYGDVVSDIMSFFKERLAACESAGIEPCRVCLDPGIGFGKTAEHNLEIMRRFSEFAAAGRPLVAGVSRKSFLGRLSGQTDAAQRDAASIAAGIFLAQRGVNILRVHDVAGHVAALKVFDSLSQL
ncbi:MAG TPA: dihydropteroate synthase [Planctomycetota bacterium]|nr:dihydropteroate synthase [Planctomycetota bacterium]